MKGNKMLNTNSTLTKKKAIAIAEYRAKTDKVSQLVIPLMNPFTNRSSHYAVQDMNDYIEDMKSMGMPTKFVYCARA